MWQVLDALTLAISSMLLGGMSKLFTLWLLGDLGFFAVSLCPEATGNF
jgi:hypothetical protein